MAKDNKKKTGSATIAQNKRARFDYFIEETIEAGISLQGWEVKSLRQGKVNISDSYITFKNSEAFLFGATITPLISNSTHIISDPLRTRKLLLTTREINRLRGLAEQDGYTVVTLSLYWKGPFIKASIGVAKGKKNYDKRDTAKDRDWKIQKERVLKSNNLR